MLKIVLRFNLKAGVDEAAFFPWLRETIWASAARYGCRWTAYRVRRAHHAYATEALWPAEADRDRWTASDDFRRLPPYPGFDSPWGAQTDMESAVLYPFDGG